MTKTKAIIITYRCNRFADNPSYNYNHKYNLIFEYNKMTDSLITGNTTSLILYELRKINEILIKTKEEHTPNFRMIKPTEKFNFSEPIINSSKLGLIGLLVYYSVFNANRKNNQFIYDIKGETWSDTRIFTYYTRSM